MAAPFTRDHCPVCSAQTRHHFLAPTGPSPDAGDELGAICAVCKTVLIYGEDGLIGRRPGTAAERAPCPDPPPAEEMAWVREELRREWAAFEEWAEAGCPGLWTLSVANEAVGHPVPQPNRVTCKIRPLTCSQPAPERSTRKCPVSVLFSAENNTDTRGP
jgi:hypothetical protein